MEFSFFWSRPVDPILDSFFEGFWTSRIIYWTCFYHVCGPFYIEQQDHFGSFINIAQKKYLFFFRGHVKLAGSKFSCKKGHLQQKNHCELFGAQFCLDWVEREETTVTCAAVSMDLPGFILKKILRGFISWFNTDTMVSYKSKKTVGSWQILFHSCQHCPDFISSRKTKRFQSILMFLESQHVQYFIFFILFHPMITLFFQSNSFHIPSVHPAPGSTRPSQRCNNVITPQRHCDVGT